MIIYILWNCPGTRNFRISVHFHKNPAGIKQHELIIFLSSHRLADVSYETPGDKWIADVITSRQFLPRSAPFFFSLSPTHPTSFRLVFGTLSV